MRGLNLSGLSVQASKEAIGIHAATHITKKEKEKRKKEWEVKHKRRFPKIIAFKKCTRVHISDESLGKWIADGCPGGYKSWDRMF